MQGNRLDGRTIVVTGATSGIGYFIAEGLTDRGAGIIVAARSPGKANAVLRMLPEPGRHHQLPFDLADVASVRLVGRQVASGPSIDGLVLNGGIAAPSHYTPGPFDVESVSGQNVLAHTEFLRLVMPALERASAARIVSIGSMLTRRIAFKRRAWLSRERYQPRRAYAMSKHATEILGFELNRRLRARTSRVTSVVAHPGGAIAALTTPTLPPLTYLGPRPLAAGPARFAQPVDSSVDPNLGQWLWRATERILDNRILT